MSTIELIISGIGVIIALVAGAFGLGHSKGKAKAEYQAAEKENQINIESMKAATQRQNETIKGAADVQETVSRMPGSAVDDELLRDWTRKD
ncbi:hypothetical protein H2241_15935 [Pantoea ananatis]|uniref:hypothetical protein n=1 Tax=Pantoea ananas TaxID=553 RepID=UPI0015894F21|nr:hypothetical protein [Pantoea ananatis]MBA4822440.1 hypothetical protein [Pantoea ananatis]QKV87624.1 hypothetical protein FOB88_11030 [Pantoea ananatis]